MVRVEAVSVQTAEPAEREALVEQDVTTPGEPLLRDVPPRDHDAVVLDKRPFRLQRILMAIHSGASSLPPSTTSSVYSPADRPPRGILAAHALHSA